MDKDQPQKSPAQRIKELEQKYGGTFHEIFGGRWPNGPNYGLMAVDYIEWSHLTSKTGGKPKVKPAKKGRKKP